MQAAASAARGTTGRRIAGAAGAPGRGGRGARCRGWGQGVYVPGHGWTWPTGSPTRGRRHDDPVDDQLRHAIAWHPQSSHTLARLAGLLPARMDAFMRGGDVLTIGQAARLARVVGVRLIDGGIVGGLVTTWDAAGRPAIRSTPAAASRRRR
jgi:hypothetical protein